MTGIVFNVMRYSVHDGPGIRTTVFFKGCPLRCRWCHNPESLSRELEISYRPERCLRCWSCVPACGEAAIAPDGDRIVTDPARCRRCGACVEACYADAREVVGREMSVSDVLLEIEKDRAFFDESGGGVTFSGGEPLLQHEFLLALLTACRERRIHSAVDTSGFAPAAVVAKTAELADLFLYDLKTIDDARHRELTGVSNQPILRNLQALAAARRPVVVRVPVIPGLNDAAQDVRAIGAFVADLETVREVHLLPYHGTAAAKYARMGREYAVEGVGSPPPELMSRIAGELRPFGLSVEVGG